MDKQTQLTLLRTDLAMLIAQLEAKFGADEAFPITSHLSAAFDAAGKELNRIRMEAQPRA